MFMSKAPQGLHFTFQLRHTRRLRHLHRNSAKEPVIDRNRWGYVLDQPKPEPEPVPQPQLEPEPGLEPKLNTNQSLVQLLVQDGESVEHAFAH